MTRSDNRKQAVYLTQDGWDKYHESLPALAWRQNLLTDAQYVKDGVMTSTGLAELRRRMPFADLDAFAANPKIADFGKLFTVQMICGYVESKVNVKA